MTPTEPQFPSLPRKPATLSPSWLISSIALNIACILLNGYCLLPPLIYTLIWQSSSTVQLWSHLEHFLSSPKHPLCCFKSRNPCCSNHQTKTQEPEAVVKGCWLRKTEKAPTWPSYSKDTPEGKSFFSFLRCLKYPWTGRPPFLPP